VSEERLRLCWSKQQSGCKKREGNKIQSFNGAPIATNLDPADINLPPKPLKPGQNPLRSFSL
jgi:hypothetical protein